MCVSCHLRAPLPGTTTTQTPSRPWDRIRKRRSWDSNVQAERCCPPPGGAVLGFVADPCVFRMTDGISTLASSTRTQGSHPDGAKRTPRVTSTFWEGGGACSVCVGCAGRATFEWTESPRASQIFFFFNFKISKKKNQIFLGTFLLKALHTLHTLHISKYYLRVTFLGRGGGAL